MPRQRKRPNKTPSPYSTSPNFNNSNGITWLHNYIQTSPNVNGIKNRLGLTSEELEISIESLIEINAAADALLQLYNDPIYCQKLGANAKQYINDYFSIENFKKSIYDFINTAKQ